jgi:A/G-specific adenine glycosylase
VQKFSTRIIDWQREHGRHALPWQTSRDPYRIWLSEIMLQQTQVASVIPYFLRFLERFPDLPALANATEDAVLGLWSGLGYYSRARCLHKSAQQIIANYAGVFPQDVDALQTLPGVGRSTAGAIAALAFGKTHAILDGNVKRVLTRHLGISGWPGDKIIENKLWALAESLLPQTHIQAYTQGMMDLGASLCTRSRPGCAICPVSADCVARKKGLVSILPTPRQRKSLPEKQIQMLMLMDHDQILLQKRPSSGIWGGLWSFPELHLEADPLLYCQTQFGLSVGKSASLPVLKHTFTHFRLHIFPIIVRISSRSDMSENPQQRWLAKHNALNVGLPAPVRKLLLQL